MKKNFILSGLSGVLFVIWIAIIKTVDVKAIGPNGTSIGLASINKGIHEYFGINDIWYQITEVLGIVALGVVAIFALAGLIQLIKRRSLFKVDGEILSLGGLFVVVMVLYVLFEKIIINYRPIIEKGSTEVEASFPSSHTMLICVVMGSTIMLLKKYISNKPSRVLLQIVCMVAMVVTVIGRLICGVHWFTDIVGGVLISFALLALFAGVLKVVEKSNE